MPVYLLVYGSSPCNYKWKFSRVLGHPSFWLNFGNRNREQLARVGKGFEGLKEKFKGVNIVTIHCRAAYIISDNTTLKRGFLHMSGVLEIEIYFVVMNFGLMED